MATRRPKVPRADALGRPNSAGRPSGAAPRSSAAGSNGSGSGDAEVIKAEFGGTRTAGGSSTPATGTRAPASGTKTPASGTKTPASGTKAPSAGSTQSTASRSANGKAPGTAKSPARGKNPAADKAGAPAKDARDLDPVPAKAFSGRMLALAVVMIAITIMLAPTVKIFLEKRAEISALEAEIASRKAEQTELNKQLSRWQDPNYVKQQARDRINMVMPGETGYWVFGGDETAGTPGGRTGSGSSANPANLPWVDALWESIRRSATD
ncbi:septum formation initiator family protein [Paenarthrobacter sp. NPDC056912]|uniref:FtsB family cell division protein n=1 Tax=Paenarthrobacter sp. NPDC056912 TaxID=3345965 RepID=UPI00366F9607